jgi:Polyketide cyclase / dehydrase and lipid transport
MDGTPQQVWEVLADGWLYPLWVVGASRMREVDDEWPERGSLLQHSVGSWPLLINDTTTVTQCQPLSLLSLRARAWPGGEADVTLHLEPDGDRTRVTIEEDAVSGAGTLIPRLVRTPLLDWRNHETMRRLAYLVERRT